MNQSEHISQEELWKFVHGSEESIESVSIGEHIHRCNQCRKKLEAMSARSAIWEIAPVLLKSKNKSELDHAQTKLDDRELDGHAAESCKNTETSWHFPISELLDRPKHPEMLGRIGNYDIEREIGRGGMGIVLKAHDSELNRPVAIKILAPHLANNGTARKRFAQEAIAAGGILHPNVIGVYSVSNEGKTPHIVMPLIDGPSLQTLVDQQGPLSEIEIVRVALQISSGLAAAHRQGLIHRDIKPANILVEGGVHRVLITDFGLARAEDDASLTCTGWLMGTPNYMSPEQTRGQRTDGRSDLFSLGSLMYFLATGRSPFRAETPLGVLHRIQQEEPTPIRPVTPQISKTLSDVIALLLKKAPEDRFQSATEVHKLLEKYLAYLRQPDISKPPRVKTPLSPELANRKLVIAGACLAASLAVVTIFCFDLTKVGFHEPLQQNRLTTEQTVLQPLDSIASSKAQASDLDSRELLTAEAREPVLFMSKADHDYADRLARGNAGKSNAVLSQAKNEACRGSYSTAERLCYEALQIDPANEDVAVNLGYVIHMQGRYDDAFTWHQRAANFADSKALGEYNLACYFAIKGETKKALGHLDSAVENRLADFLCVAEVENDPDLHSLHGNPHFIASVESMNKCHQTDSEISF